MNRTLDGERYSIVQHGLELDLHWNDTLELGAILVAISSQYTVQHRRKQIDKLLIEIKPIPKLQDKLMYLNPKGLYNWCKYLLEEAGLVKAGT